MSYVTTREMLKQALEGRYAIGAFNAENMEMVQAIIAGAEQMRAPVMIQTTPGTLKYADPVVFAGMVSRMAETASVPVALHLDHGNSYELAEYCVKEGYTSVMIDGSLLPFEENIALSRRVVEMAGDIPVEAELGTVGGKEDTHSAGIAYTDPDQAMEFVARTEVDSLAVGVGTSHGVYKGVPRVNVEVLSAIRKVVSIPLVLHGTSGVPDEQVRDCVSRGICKVNYATDLRIAFMNGVKAHMASHPEDFDPKKYGIPGMEEVKKYVMQKMEVVGSCNRA